MLLRVMLCCCLTATVCRADEPQLPIPPAPAFDDAVVPTPAESPSGARPVPRYDTEPTAPAESGSGTVPHSPHPRATVSQPSTQPCPCRQSGSAPPPGLQTYSGLNPMPLRPATIWTDPPTTVGPATAGGLHNRYPYYSYRAPWYTPGPASLNVTIVW